MSHAAGTQRLVVGLVRGVHGLRGAVRVEVLSDEPARFAKGSVLHTEGSVEPLTVVWSQRDEPGILLRFREILTRDDADALRDRYLEADVEIGELPDDAVYWHEVEGARVVSADGEELGTVEEVFRAGEFEVFVVRGGVRGELYVPAVKAVVTDFAPRDGRIVIDAEALGLEEAKERRPRGRRTTRALKQAQAASGAVGTAPETASSPPEAASSPPEAASVQTDDHPADR